MTDAEVRPLRAADKIQDELNERSAQIAELYERIERHNEAGEYEEMEEAEDELRQLPLDVRLKTSLYVQISTGGPGDEFEIEVERRENGGWELADTHATYRFIEWFDPAEMRTNDAAVIRWLESLIELFYDS